MTTVAPEKKAGVATAAPVGGLPERIKTCRSETVERIRIVLGAEPLTADEIAAILGFESSSASRGRTGVASTREVVFALNKLADSGEAIRVIENALMKRRTGQGRSPLARWISA